MQYTIYENKYNYFFCAALCKRSLLCFVIYTLLRSVLQETHQEMHSVLCMVCVCQT